MSSFGILQNHQLIKSPASTSLKFNCLSSFSPSSSPLINCFPFHKSYQPLVKVDEYNFFSSKEACSTFTSVVLSESPQGSEEGYLRDCSEGELDAVDFEAREGDEDEDLDADDFGEEEV
ncbi:hypothetical protein ACFX2I_033421 [Malus domestica]